MKLYRQVSTDERMPEKNGQYLTDIGNMQFDIQGNRFIYYCEITDNKLNRHANYWMEEIEIPHEEQVDKVSYKEADIEFKDEDFECPSGTCYNDWQMGFIKGTKWIISTIKG